MDLNTWLIILAVIAVILIVLKLIFKTIKVILFVGIILIAAALLYDHSLPVEKDYEQPSIFDCEKDIECAYVIGISDCNLVANKCNNILKTENYIVNGKKCNQEKVIIDENISCKCVIQEGVNYCKAL